MNDHDLIEMPVEHIQRQIDTLNTKMDRILEALDDQRVRRMAIEDLEADLMRVGNDAYKVAMTGLEEYAETVNGKEVQQLVWNLARNLQSINKVVLQMESGMAFLDDVSPIVRQMAIDMTERLDEWDRKGYFSNLQAGYIEMGRILSSIDKEDIHVSGELMAGVIEHLKSMDWSRLNRGEVSYGMLFKELRSPEVKKGLALLLWLIRAIAAPRETNTRATEANTIK